MSDPLDALREPPRRVEPDPVFAIVLRARLERSLNRPRPFRAGQPVELAPVDRIDYEEASMTTTTAPAVLQQLSPYLAVTDGRRAIDWYVDAFGAEPIGDPVIMPDGRVGHAELRIGSARVMLADEFPDIDFLAPTTRGGGTVNLHLSFAEATEVDAVIARAVAAGATLERPAADGPYGHSGVVIDPSGHRWFLMAEAPTSAPAPAAAPAAGPAPAAAPAAGHGDVGYLTIATPDTQRFRDFYGPLLGWDFVPGRVADGWTIHGVTPMSGVHRADEHAIVPLYQVRDLAAALVIVRERGGTPGEAQQQPYGLMADCTDDQGEPFYLLQS